MRAHHARLLSRRRLIAAAAASMAVALAACADDDDLSVAFEEPAGDATVAGGTAVSMTAEGLTIEEAGEVREGAGHFHVIADDGCADEGAAIPRDADHVHFGKGQAEGTVYLGPGDHELCLQAADGEHVALAATEQIDVTVAISSQEEWCDVVEEVDDLFAVTDNSDDEFEVRQLSYEAIRRLIAQLADGIDHVDGDARGDVEEALEFGSTIAGAVADAADAAAAEAAIEEIFAGGEDLTDSPGAAWIGDACGVDVNG